MSQTERQEHSNKSQHDVSRTAEAPPVYPSGDAEATVERDIRDIATFARAAHARAAKEEQPAERFKKAGTSILWAAVGCGVAQGLIVFGKWLFMPTNPVELPTAMPSVPGMKKSA